MGLLDDLDRRRERELNDRENSARLANAYATFTTTGLGTLQYKKRVNFGLTFIEKPFVSHAAYVDMDYLYETYYPDGDLEDETDDSPELTLPVCSGFVTEWDQDERGLYVGCWIAVRVYLPFEDWPELPEGVESPMPEIEHHFTFAAVAMKDMPMSREDAIE